MKLKIIAPLILLSGTATAEIPYGAWNGAQSDAETRIGYEHPEADEVRCMALYCSEPRLDGPAYPRKEIIDIPDHGVKLPSKEVAELLKDLGAPVAPAKPADENEAREEFYRALHRHADGEGTIEQVESAYRELLPYRG